MITVHMEASSLRNGNNRSVAFAYAAMPTEDQLIVRSPHFAHIDDSIAPCDEARGSSCDGLFRRQPQRVDPDGGIVDVRIGIRSGWQAEGVGTDISSGFGIVVAEVVVVEAGFGVKVLAGKAQRSVGGAVGCPGSGTPQSASCVPGDLTLLIDEFTRSAGEVSDDREEAGVDFLLRGVGRPDAFGLGYGAQSLVVPSEGEGVGQAQGCCGLFAKSGAVPGEVDAFDDRFAIGGQAQFGCAAAERIVGVAPTGAVRGRDLGEAVFGVPFVAPSVRFTRQAGFLTRQL